MKKNVIIILDPAHGADVKGKRSPDGRHREFAWSRARVKAIRLILTSLGYKVYVTTESENEPGLSKRRNFATQICGGERKLLLSLHNNAAGSGDKWMSARGAEVYTTPGATDADICADYISNQFKKDFPEVKVRPNKEARFAVLMGSGYMGVLVEWLFQDNKDDVELLMDSEMNRRFESSIVDAIEGINNYFGG